MGRTKRDILGVFFGIAILTAFVLSCSIPTNPADPTDSASAIGSQAELISTGKQGGVLEVYLTDWPLQGRQVTNLWITVERIDIHGEESGWHTIIPQTSKFDLIQLIDDVSLVGIYALPSDYYTQIRLILGPGNHIVFDDSDPIALSIPSGQQTGIKIVGGFDLPEGYTAKIVLDFNAERSVRMRGSKGIGTVDDPLLLVPVIKIEEVVLEPLNDEPGLYPRIVIDTHSPNRSFTTDTYIDLFDSEGDPDADNPWTGDDTADTIAWDDNSNPDFKTMARIDYTGGLPPGTYYIRVRGALVTADDYYAIRVLSLNPGDTLPAYDFSQDVAEKPDAYEAAPGDDEPKSGGVPSNPVDIGLGVVLSRSLDYDDTTQEGDIDWFRLVLP